MNTFSRRLTELSDSSGKSQNEISKELGTYKQKFSRWKTGYTEPNLDELILIASYFDVSTDYLLGLEDETGTKINLINKK